MKLIRKIGTRKDKSGNNQSWAVFWGDFCKKEVEKHLYAGLNAKSCGCMHGELITKSLIGQKRGYKHGGTGTKLFSVWANIKDRCLNFKNHAYEDYGGRGITICPEWANDYAIFRDWAVNNDYQEGLEIDRRDNDKDYSPENCRFVVRKENVRNKRNTITMKIVNEIRELWNTGNYTQKELVKIYKATSSSISKIINNKSWINEAKENNKLI